MNVLVVGSVALDNVETPFGKIEDAIGGSAIFFSTAASYFAPVNLVGVVGEDFPLNSIEFLKERNVDLTGLKVEEGETFRWGGKYFDDLNKRETLFTHLNVFEAFKPILPEEYKNSEFVFLANIDPTLQQYVLGQMNGPRLVACDTMNYWIERTWDDLERTLRMVDILIINDEEVRQLTNEYNFIRAARVIRSMGPETLIVKKGENGALLITEDRFFSVPAYPLESVFDPTGAGDVFAGGFMGYVAKKGVISEETFREALICGSVMASFCVQRFSIEMLKSTSENQIKERYEKFREITQFGNYYET